MIFSKKYKNNIRPAFVLPQKNITFAIVPPQMCSGQCVYAGDVQVFGIIIKMFFKPKEHDPAHIHAIYNEYVGIFDIHTFQMTDGDLPLKAQNLVREWLETNYEKLLEMWNTQVITKLEPLK